jgi:hypothetical protein
MNSKLSTGYIGYHTNFEGKQFFLRSRLEFIVALWLDYHKISYEVEPYKFCENFRPDFVIKFPHKTIIEVKSSNRERLKVIEERQNYYKLLGYKLIVLGRYRHFTKIKRKIPNCDLLIKEFESKDMSHIDMSGIRNPRYGTKCSESTKNKIRQAAIERFKSAEYRKMHSQAQKEFYKTKNGEKLKKKISKARTKPKIEKNCEICGQIFIVSSSSKKRTCSEKCRAKLYSNAVKNGDIVLPKQNPNVAKFGVIIRTLGQWVDKAGMELVDLETDETFSNFLTLAKQNGNISKRTVFTTREKFFNHFGGKHECLQLIERYILNGKTDFKNFLYGN